MKINFQSAICLFPRSLLNDLKDLKLNDGYENWRRQEASDLTYLMQKRLHNLQNPENCSAVKILKCASPNWGMKCGYGKHENVFIKLFNFINYT